jgi:hypothetical protein
VTGVIGAHRLAALALAALLAGGAGVASAGSSKHAGGFRARVLFRGAELSHPTAHGREQISQPDDITELGGRIFVTFQNGVGPQGQASSTGNLASTIVELSRHGRALRQWDIKGHCDGLTADPAIGRVIATVNEDANSSLFLIDPAKARPAHYRYDRATLPSHGGTDAISIYRGVILISASAPGTSGKPAPQAAYPAVYRVTLRARTHVARVRALFGDEARARLANAGGHGRVKLALTDPDSNEVVPAYAGRFAGDFVLDSQGDKEQIYVAGAGTRRQSLSVLRLSQSINDSAFPSGARGTLYATDGSSGDVYAITGPFPRGSAFVAVTPCDAEDAPSTCPGPGYPANYLGRLDLLSGHVTPAVLRGAAVAPQGLLFATS